MFADVSKAVLLGAVVGGTTPALAAEMTDAEIENLVRRSYQYVAMYNVNNKFAMSQGGWQSCVPDTELKDHTMQDIARPNNDTLYTSCLLDLTQGPMVLNLPAFDSEYISLMITGYDHYVNIPASTRLGDFREPETMLIFSARTAGYDGGEVAGIDRFFEATGDFISAVFRVMPHATDPERFDRIMSDMKSVKAVPLSEFSGNDVSPYEQPELPAVGATDADVFGTNLLEVMQFVFNHTTFDAENAEDQAVLAAYEPLGISTGKVFDPAGVEPVDGARLKQAAQDLQREYLGKITDLEHQARNTPLQFQPKGHTDLEAVVSVSIAGPIGIPQEEAVYPSIPTSDGEQMNAMNDYVIRMSNEDMPPAGAFWSVTLYDLNNGFFVPNDRKKYSVGLNGGMLLDEDGGIEIHIAANQPEGVPEENWLPITRDDIDLSPTMRIYVPDLEAYKTWKVPVAEMVE